MGFYATDSCPASTRRSIHLLLRACRRSRDPAPETICLFWQVSISGHRSYSPELGRWTARDPIEEQGGVNLYSYADNGGFSAVDVLGLYAAYDDDWREVMVGITTGASSPGSSLPPRDWPISRVKVKAELHNAPKCALLISATIARDTPRLKAGWSLAARRWVGRTRGAPENSWGLPYPNLWLMFDHDAPGNNSVYSAQQEERAILSASPEGRPDALFGVYRWQPTPDVAPSDDREVWNRTTINSVKTRDPLTLFLFDSARWVSVNCNCRQQGELELYLWYGDSKWIGSVAQGIGAHAAFAHWKVTYDKRRYSERMSDSITMEYEGVSQVPPAHRARFGEGGAEWGR